MKCPYCSHVEDTVIETRTIKDWSAIRRRRECLACGKRFTTYEEIEAAPLMVLKLDGRREPFNRAKMKRGLATALAKRPVSMEAIDKLVREVEEECHELGVQELPSNQIGEMVMKKLRQVDEVAYIRFASVYRRFQDAGEFRKELESM
jgi:transcriptional repressor NrdR